MEKELSPEQIAGRFAGFVNFTANMSEEEKTEALSKQPDVIKNMYALTIKKEENKDFSFEEGSNEQASNSESQGQTGSNAEDTKQDQKQEINKEELYQEFIKRFSDENSKKQIENTKEKASKLAGDYFSKYTDEKEKQKDILFVRNYVAGAVSNGGDYHSSTEEALEYISNKNKKEIQTRGFFDPSSFSREDEKPKNYLEQARDAQLEEYKNWANVKFN